MSGGTAYLDLPSGERIEIPMEMPDVTKADGNLWDGSFELPESVKKLMEWADEVSKLWTGNGNLCFSINWGKLRKNFNPPDRWKQIQDKRRNPNPMGRNTYLYKARKIRSLARSTHTKVVQHKDVPKNNEQRKHTFRITHAQCAPCSGYDVKCPHYRKNDVADTKHRSF